MKIDERFVHVPVIKPGNSLFEGKPLIYKDTYEILGADGVEKLDAFMKKIIEIRKQIISRVIPTAYGLPTHVRVFDFEKRLMLHICEGGSQFQSKELENLVGQVSEKNYSVLHNTGEKKLENPGEIKFRNYVNSWLDHSGGALRGLSLQEIAFFKENGIFLK